MGKRGPAPTPTALRVLHGETKPSRINRNEPQPIAGTPRPPRWLRKEARPYWRDLVRQLEPMRVLTLADAGALAMLADAELDYVEAQKDITDRGGQVILGANGYVRNPAVMNKNHAFRRYRDLAVQFGLTPAARVSLTSQPDNDDDPQNLLS